MRIGRTKKLACDFRSRVRTNRLREMQALREGHRFRDAIDRRTGGKDKSLHAGKPGSFEEMQRSTDIGVVIKPWLANRWSHARPRGQVGNQIEFFSMKKRVDGCAVAQIQAMNADIRRHGLDIGPLDLRVVKIVKVVENRNDV